MKIVPQSAELLWITPQAEQMIELGGRVCYKSEDRITAESAPIFIDMVCKRQHESVIEHASASFRIVCDRGVSHEIVRHRLASYCLSGDTKIVFDLPSGRYKGHRRANPIMLRDLYERWVHGTVSVANRKKTPTYAEKIDPLRRYSAKELSLLVNRRRETINNLVRLGYLEGETCSDLTTKSPNKKTTFVRGSSWISYANKETSTSCPMKDRIRAMNLRSCNEETGEIEHTNIVGITTSGRKSVFEVVLDNGYSAKMSKDHRLLTNKGWASLEDLVELSGIGSSATWRPPSDTLVAVNGYTVGVTLNAGGNLRGMRLSSEGRSRLKLAKIGVLNPGWKGGITTERAKIGAWTHTVAAKVHEKFDFTCQLCGVRGGKLHAHHLDPVYHNLAKAYDFDNLISIHSHCHHKLEGQHLELDLLDAVSTGIAPMQFWIDNSDAVGSQDAKKKAKTTTRLVRDWAGVVSVRYVGEEETFDIEVAGPFHNFVANGFIVHNSQESTRYCNYGKEKFGNQISVIEPPGLTLAQRGSWLGAIEVAEREYLWMLESGCSPQIARSVLPTCLKTEIVMTCNFREWKHFLKLRTSTAAHPQIREIALAIQEILQEVAPSVFKVC